MNETVDPVEAVKKCLAGDEQVALLKIFQFQDDVEAHDDDLQERLEKEFLDAFNEARIALNGVFGSHTDLELEEGEDLVPLCGVFRACSWHVGETSLYLAAIHEDRETPFLLIAGVQA